jgi:hypothetical protein
VTIELIRGRGDVYKVMSTRGENELCPPQAQDCHARRRA